MFERRARRESATAMMRWLATLGYPMGRTTVRNICDNEAYLGITRSGSYRNEEAHAPLISQELFTRAQSAKSLPPNRTGALSNLAMLKGLVYCVSCGSRMPPTWTQGAVGPTGKRAKLPAYACAGRSKSGCEAPAYIRVDALDTFIDDLVVAMLRDGTGPLAEAVAKTERVEEAVDALHAAERKLNDLLTNVTLRDVLDVNEYAEMVTSQKGRIELLRLDYAEAKAQAEMAGAFEGAMVKAWPGLAAMEKREILSHFIDRITVTPAFRKRGIPVERRIQIIDRRGVWIDPSMARLYVMTP